jgi:hypothetical protein
MIIYRTLIQNTTSKWQRKQITYNLIMIVLTKHVATLAKDADLTL